MKKFILFLAMLFITSSAFAASTDWQIVPNESSIKFTAIQNNAPVTGQFNHFTGTIQFDPNDLKTSHFKIIVDMNSVMVSYKDVVDTLKMPDWFNIKMFPNAVFTADQVIKIGDQHYQAKGYLTIRDKTLPVTLEFIMKEYSSTKAKAEGETVLKRTEYGIGQGEWASTDSIKDEIKVQFVVSAIK